MQLTLHSCLFYLNHNIKYSNFRIYLLSATHSLISYMILPQNTYVHICNIFVNNFLIVQNPYNLPVDTYTAVNVKVSMFLLLSDGAFLLCKL